VLDYNINFKLGNEKGNTLHLYLPIFCSVSNNSSTSVPIEGNSALALSSVLNTA